MVCFQSTPTSVGRSLWIRSCGDGNCSRRATVRLGIDTLITSILVFVLVYRYILCFRQLNGFRWNLDVALELQLSDSVCSTNTLLYVHTERKIIICRKFLIDLSVNWKSSLRNRLPKFHVLLLATKQAVVPKWLDRHLLQVLCAAMQYICN